MSYSCAQTDTNKQINGCLGSVAETQGERERQNGRHKPVRESLNGQQSDFYYREITTILDATYGKDPPISRDSRQDSDKRLQSNVGDKQGDGIALPLVRSSGL
eukprot:COSAG02_NODE_50_length_44860_cov_203.992739_14_plen_103_part_00